jgi:hypothetical protein
MRTIFLGCDKDFRRGAWLAGWRTQLPHGTPELSESHLFPRYHQSAFFISSTSCCFSYLCCEWPPCFRLCHRIRLDASCRICFVHRSSHSNKTSDLEDDKPRVLRDQPLEMGACGSSCCGGTDIEFWIGGRKHILMIHRQISRRLV